MEISDKYFEEIITECLDLIPEKYASRMNNVGVVWENNPSQAQRQALKLHCNQTLYGLYEGVPLTKRAAGYNLVVPDKITIFKEPLCHSVSSILELKKQVYHTIWHEIAHHFGLDHEQIHKLESKT